MKARLPAGYGGGASNMNAMLKQAQKMQEEMARVQAELEGQEFSARAGGGAVEAVVTGSKVLKALHIDPEVVDPQDVEMLQDLVIAAVNEAMKNAEDASSAEMGKITGGMGIPGM